MSQADNTVRLGIMAVNSGDSQKGIQSFEEALKINPDHIGAYLGLVWALPDKHVRPYVNKLLSFSVVEIEEYLKHNPEMLESPHVSLFNQVIYYTESLELVKAFLNAGANPNEAYILRIAVMSEKRDELVSLLLKAGADPNREYQLHFNNNLQEQCTALRDAIWVSNDVEIAKFLIDCGADVNYIVKYNDGRDCSLLNIAIQKNNLEMVKLLLNSGADANQGRRVLAGDFYWGNKIVYLCPLSEAIRTANNVDMVCILLEYGADPNYQYTDYTVYTNRYACERNGCCALYDVTFHDNTEILQMLLYAGINLNTKYQEKTLYADDPDVIRSEMSIIQFVREKGHNNIVKLLNEKIEKNRLMTEQKMEWDRLVAEQKQLKDELPKINGLFADRRRKKMEERLREIEEKLKRMGAQ